MSAGLLVDQKCTSVAFPKLSVNGIPIGGRRKADSLSYTIINRHPLDSSFHYREFWPHTLQGNDLYSSPARAIYLRPRATSVDIYC